ncbi:MAG: 50S ribosomal protein L9 [Myxococcota bacterium]|jgi:large subunit ribosomal protein L9|nr:50S ribosomal protein L9 [Myxococcota bacterium]MEC9439857.1 50S ribosomal protein L9 [Myxococcota bacterium]
MQVILTEDVKNVGDMGEIVEVADGYGRNFLIPKGFALPATSNNRKQLEHQMRLIEKRRESERAAAREILGDIDGISITIPMRVGESDRLYGSVTNRDIATALSQQGVEVDRKQIEVDRPLSELGIYQVPIKLASGIFANVRVWVVAM